MNPPGCCILHACLQMWVPLQLPLQYFHASHRACTSVKGFAYCCYLLCCCDPIVNLESCLLRLLGKNVCFVPPWSTVVVEQSHQPKFGIRCVAQTAIACFSKRTCESTLNANLHAKSACRSECCVSANDTTCTDFVANSILHEQTDGIAVVKLPAYLVYMLVYTILSDINVGNRTMKICCTTSD